MKTREQQLEGALRRLLAFTERGTSPIEKTEAEQEAKQALARDGGEEIKCIQMLTDTIDDVLPQIGNLVLQDYGKLNDGLVLARKILSPVEDDFDEPLGDRQCDVDGDECESCQ